MSSHGAPRKRPATEQTASSTKRRRRPRKHSKPPPVARTPPSSPPDSPPRTNKRAHLNHLQISRASFYSTTSSKWSQNSSVNDSLDADFPTSLKLLTYNVWSSSPEHTHSQTQAILHLLSESRADVISLQEVSKPFETQLRKQGWIQAEWVLATSLDEYWRVAGKDGQGKGKKDAKREGVLIMVKRDLWTKESEVGIVKLKRANNEQAKALVVVRIVREGTEILRITTSHFSSLPQNSRLRQSQYTVALNLLNASPRASHSILLGDFNASSSAELDLFTSSLHDVGPQPSKAQLSNLPTNVEKLELKFRNRPTFGSLYPFVDLKSTKPRKPRRIDRIYVSKGTKYGQYRELGGEALSGEKDQLGKGGKRYPSDHLAVGIRVEL